MKYLARSPSKCLWVTVCDRGCDCGEFFYETKKLGWDAVARACHDRCIEVNNENTQLMGWMRSLRDAGGKCLFK
jgi:hypothetical protein